MKIYKVMKKNMEIKKSPKVIINITYCFKPEYMKQVQECLDTWIPLVEYPTIISVSNMSLDTEYCLVGNQLHCKCTDYYDLGSSDINFSLKRWYFIKWAVETKQEFDYLFITSSDTFIHPHRFKNLVEEYYKDDSIDFAGDVWPDIFGGQRDYSEEVRRFIEPNLYWNIEMQPWDNPDMPREHKQKSHAITAGGGSGYILSKRACKIISDNFDTLLHNASTSYLGNSDDIHIGDLLRDNNIFLYYDVRFNQSRGITIPYIEDSSFVAVQHYRDGDFKMILDKLGIRR